MNQHTFQHQVIIFCRYTMAAIIGFFHSAQVEEYKYVTVYVLTLHSFRKKCLKSFYQPFVRNGKLDFVFLLVQKQTDGFNNGLLQQLY